MHSGGGRQCHGFLRPCTFPLVRQIQLSSLLALLFSPYLLSEISAVLVLVSVMPRTLGRTMDRREALTPEAGLLEPGRAVLVQMADTLGHRMPKKR